MPPKKGKGGAFGKQAAGGAGASGSGAGAAAAAPPPRVPPPAAPPGASVEEYRPVQAALPLIPLPRRPGFGRAGKPIRLYANHFNITAFPEAVLRYQIDIVSPPRPPRPGAGPPPAPRALPSGLCRALLANVAARLGWGNAWACDGQHILLGARELLPDTRTGELFTRVVQHPDGGDEQFTVRIFGQGAVRVRDAVQGFSATPGAPLPFDALNMLDILTHHRRAMDAAHWASVGRSFLNRGDTAPLGAGLEVWLGYTASVRPAQGGGVLLSMVMDRAAAAFVKAQPVMQLVADVAGNGRVDGVRFDERTFRKLNKTLRGIKVEIRVGTYRRQYRARGVTRLPSSRCVFRNTELELDESVAAYFNRKLDAVPAQRLRYDYDWPCVDVSKSASRQIWLPMELCTVVAGQRRQLVDDPMASAAMIRQTTLLPDRRWRVIEDNVQNHVAGDATMTAFGVNVAAHMKQLSGRVLEPPVLKYAANKTLTASWGAWNLRGVQLQTKGAAPAAWAAVCCDPDDLVALQGFVPHFVRGLGMTAGIVLPQPVAVETPRSGETLEDMLVRVVRSGPRGGASPTFLLCVLDGTKESYERVKSALETQQAQLGVVSQCMLPKHLGGGGPGGGPGGRGGRDGGRGGRDGGRGGFGGGGGPNPMYIANLSQKINAKLGGTNTIVSPSAGMPGIAGICEVPTMLFGADVTHPPPGSDVPSVAAVVGSLDGHGARYATRLYTQASRQEHIGALGAMAHDLLLAFEACTRQRPERIIFFRDGVSEGQFQAVLRDELPLLKAAFAQLGDGSYAPRLTFVVVQKRHATRLFVEHERDSHFSVKGNVPPGTVVDTEICHPHEHDFYMVAHAGIQGTMRPVHYHVLLDENNYSADVLQAMTYKLCHLYCRCTRSVSLVPPVYYAHLAASRGRTLRAAADASDAGSVASGAGAGPAGGGAVAMDVHASLQSRMFFV